MTTLTNKWDVDDAIVAALRNDPYDNGGADFSTTQLCLPPQIAALQYEHTDEIEEDAGDALWRLLGSAAHVVLEQAGVENALQEERLFAEVEGVRVSGKFDLYREPAELVDLKVTSVWSFLMGDKPEWVAQGQINAALLRRHGFPVEKITILAILRDHMKSKQYDEGYPKIPYLRKQLPVWPADKAEAYLAERVRLHVAARDGDYPECTSQERWERPAKYAVMKDGRKSAMRVLDSEEDAQRWLSQNGKPGERLSVDYRPGENVRCRDYCAVSRWCRQAEALGVNRE